MDQVTRRRFLARASAFGTVVGAGIAFPALPGAPGSGWGPYGTASAQVTGSAALDAVEEFSLDTMRGVTVMVMPGPDAW